jgi:hypothetical protein
MPGAGAEAAPAALQRIRCPFWESLRLIGASGNRGRASVFYWQAIKHHAAA